MYHSESGINPALQAAPLRASVRVRIGATIYLLGLTSLLTDVSAEMVASVLPVYLFSILRLSPFEYGMIDGLYNGSTAIVRLIAAYFSDRTQHHKATAVAGYLLSALSRIGLLVAGFAGWTSVAAVILIDRVGKGIRTAPRDALIASHAPDHALGAAFGVHRAMDAIGAIIGPLLATGILLWLPRRFDYVFMTSFCFAVFGLLVIGLFVQPKTHDLHATHDAPEAHPLRLRETLRAMATRQVVLLAVCATVLSLFTLSDNMIYIGLQRQMGFDPARIPLLFVATASVFMCLAIPAGKLADRFGHLRVFLLGYLLLSLVYCLFAILPPFGNVNAILTVLLLGAYYAATDGVLAALIVKQLPPDARATGLALITSLISLARMGSSILFGWLWEAASQPHAVGSFGIAMLVALGCTLLVAARLQRTAGPHDSSASQS